MIVFVSTRLWVQSNPPQKGGFFYFTGLVAKQVAREGFSGEIKLCLNLNEVRKLMKIETPGFITLRSRVQIPVSLHENQGLTLNRGSFSVFA